MPPSSRRSDAARNRQRLVAAAREVFDEHGLAAPLDDIARRAGVGNATMYRHFANRRELALAVYADEVTDLCDRGAQLLDEPDAGEALSTWLSAFARHVATKRELAVVEVDTPAPAGSELFARWHEAMRRTTAALVERAERAGAVRPDLDPGDLLLVVSGIALTGVTGEGVDRLLEIVQRGVRPPGATRVDDGTA